MGLIRKIRLFFPNKNQQLSWEYYTQSLQSLRPEDNPIYKAIIRQIKNTVSSLGVDTYQRGKGGIYKAYSHPMQWILNHPNKEDTKTSFFATLTGHYTDHRNAYIHYVLGKDGYPIWWELVDPKKVQVKRFEKEPYDKYFVIEGESKLFTDREILHIPHPDGYNGTYSIPPRDALKGILTLHNKILKYMECYFDNSPGNRIMLAPNADKFKDVSAKKLMQELLDWWAEYMKGPEVAGRPGVLPLYTELKEIKQSSNAEADVSSLATLCERIICNEMTFPHYMLSGDYGNNLESQNINYYQKSILPMTKNIEEHLNKFFTQGDSAYMYVRHNYDNLLMVDANTRTNILIALTNNGLMSKDEGRDKLELSKYDGNPKSIGAALWNNAAQLPMMDSNMDMYFAAAQAALTQSQNDPSK